MALGKRLQQRQAPLFVATADLPRSEPFEADSGI